MSDIDSNPEAARIVRQATDADNALPADTEAAWDAWIDRIQDIDDRVAALLRAAFEAGVEAGGKAFAASGGRAGGKARARALSAEQRQAIARRAAKKRWGDDQSESGASSG